MIRKARGRTLVVAAALLLGTVVAAVPARAQGPARRPVSAPAARTLTPTPPMGFNNWNAFGCDVTEALIKGTVHIDNVRAE